MVPTGLPNPFEVSETLFRISGQSRRLVLNFLERQNSQGPAVGIRDLSLLSKPFIDLATALSANSGKLMGAQLQLWQDYLDLWKRTMLASVSSSDAGGPDDGITDRRFKHDDWQDSLLFDFMKRAYLLVAGWTLNTVRQLEGLDEHTARKVEFYTQQFVDALSPTNFVLTNPEVLRATVESGGQNLLKGLSNLLEDLERGKGKLLIRMTDLDAFELGVNIATTPGKVVFQN
jgi:polyhydroxyalkanoate synthase